MTELERFEPPFCTRPLTGLIGPPYGKGKGQDLETGKCVEVKRDSARATVHGGVLPTLAYQAFEYPMARACGARADSKEALV